MRSNNNNEDFFTKHPVDTKKEILQKLFDTKNFGELGELRLVSKGNKKFVDELVDVHLAKLNKEKKYKELLELYHQYPYIANKILAQGLMNVDAKGAIDLLNQLSNKDDVYLAHVFIQLFRKKENYLNALDEVTEMYKFIKDIDEHLNNFDASAIPQLEKLIDKLACVILTRIGLEDSIIKNLCDWYIKAVDKLCMLKSQQDNQQTNNNQTSEQLRLNYTNGDTNNPKHPEYIVIKVIHSAADLSARARRNYSYQNRYKDDQLDLITRLGSVANKYVNLSDLLFESDLREGVNFSELNLSGMDFSDAEFKKIKLDGENCNIGYCNLKVRSCSKIIFNEMKNSLFGAQDLENLDTFKKALNRIGIAIISNETSRKFIFKSFMRLIDEKRYILKEIKDMKIYLLKKQEIIMLLKLVAKNPYFENDEGMIQQIQKIIQQINDTAYLRLYINDIKSISSTDQLNRYIGAFVKFLDALPKETTFLGISNFTLDYEQNMETKDKLVRMREKNWHEHKLEYLKASFCNILVNYFDFLKKDEKNFESTFSSLYAYLTTQVLANAQDNPDTLECLSANKMWKI